MTVTAAIFLSLAFQFQADANNDKRQQQSTNKDRIIGESIGKVLNQARQVRNQPWKRYFFPKFFFFER